MNILFSLALLIHFSTYFHGHCTTDNLQLGANISLVIPDLHMNGLFLPAIVLKTSQPVPSFRAGLTVEAVEGKYVCSFDVFLGNFKVWSSSHLSRFLTTEKCVIGLTMDGDLQLTGKNDQIGWCTATHGKGIKGPTITHPFVFRIPNELADIHFWTGLPMAFVHLSVQIYHIIVQNAPLERLQLLNTGNLVLVDEFNNITWQSFQFPTNVMLYGQTLSAGTKLTSPSNSNSNYSFEIQQEKLALYLNSGKFKYSYWEFNPKKPENISFVRLAVNGLHLFNNKSHKIAQIPCKRLKLLRFFAIENTTGNLGFYYYSTTTHKFEASFQALKSKCDQPNACKVNEICTSSECSILKIKGSLGNFCESSRGNMKGIRSVITILRDENKKMVNTTKESCAGSCVKDCTCVGALFTSNYRECYLYGEIRGMKEVNNIGGETSFMVKVLEGENNGNGLKKWQLILIVVVDGIVLFVCLGGMGLYMLWKRKNEANNN